MTIGAGIAILGIWISAAAVCLGLTWFAQTLEIANEGSADGTGSVLVTVLICATVASCAVAHP